MSVPPFESAAHRPGPVAGAAIVAVLVASAVGWVAAGAAWMAGASVGGIICTFYGVAAAGLGISLLAAHRPVVGRPSWSRPRSLAHSVGSTSE